MHVWTANSLHPRLGHLFESVSFSDRGAQISEGFSCSIVNSVMRKGDLATLSSISDTRHTIHAALCFYFTAKLK